MKKSKSKDSQIIGSSTSSTYFTIVKILFFVALVISYLVFAGMFFNNKDLTNPYIKSHASWVISVEFVMFSIIYAVFGFLTFQYIAGKKVNKLSLIFSVCALVAILIIHYLAFNSAFEDVDDNASYMIAAKSLVEKGAPYYLYLPEIKPDTEGAIGLPLMLIPFYLIWGMNYHPMEILIFITFIGSLMASFLFFRKTEGTLFALIITIIYAVHPYIVSFSSIIMTEIPYIFWSLLALYLCLKFEEHPKINIVLLLLSVFAVFMTYLTRAIGAGMVVAVIVYFLLKSNIWQNIRSKKILFYKDVAFKKFFMITALLVIVMVVYQLWAKSLGGASQAESLAKMNIYDQFMKNLSSVWKVLSQNIFAGKIVRSEIEPVNLMWGLILLVMCVGLIHEIIKKQLAALYFVFVMMVLLIGNAATQDLVVSRYLIVFTPLMIYFLYKGVYFLVGLADKRKQLAKVASIAVFCFLLGNSFIGSAFNIQRSTKASLYDPPYQAFLDCAVWAKDNLPKDAIVASRKERIFYVFSNGIRGYKHFALNDNRMIDSGITMEEYEKKKLEQFQKNNTSYVIIDTFTSSSVKIIFPIIQRNPDKFKLIKIIGDEQKGACYVFEVIKWWS